MSQLRVGPFANHQLIQAKFPSSMASEIFSAVMIVGIFVLADGTTEKIDASTTRNPPIPYTRPL